MTPTCRPLVSRLHKSPTPTRTWKFRRWVQQKFIFGTSMPMSMARRQILVASFRKTPASTKTKNRFPSWFGLLGFYFRPIYKIEATTPRSEPSSTFWHQPTATETQHLSPYSVEVKGHPTCSMYERALSLTSKEMSRMESTASFIDSPSLFGDRDSRIRSTKASISTCCFI